MPYLESGGEGVFWKEGGGGASNVAAGSRQTMSCEKKLILWRWKANFD